MINKQEKERRKNDWIGFILWEMGYPQRARKIVKRVTASPLQKAFMYVVEITFKTKKGNRSRAISMGYFPHELFE